MRIFVSRFDSRAQNPKLDDLLELAETDPNAATELSKEHFSAQTFDAAFIITTFVQIFETLLSNRNATLLKLPNFAKTIFLLDEIQALPPRLYIFFTAYLRVWCEKFDCYAILSTATMPHLEILTALPEHHKHHPRRLFPDYKSPSELLNYRHYFKEDVFNRYEIVPHDKCEWGLSKLADELEGETESCLVILNTIQDTKDLFLELTQNRELLNTEIVLLNTHFILDDRRRKIEKCKQKSSPGKRVILISTQLIEAGVDIDFPVVYRDWCPLPNLIQSAGRCNRNKQFKCGKVVFFTLADENNKPRAHCIYRHPSDKSLLEQTHTVLSKPHQESELLDVQRTFFEGMARNFAIGDHSLWVNDKWDEHANLIEYIADFNYPVVGSFRLITAELGDEFQLFVPSDASDKRWNQLADLGREIAQAYENNVGREAMQVLQLRLDGVLRAMSNSVVTVRCKECGLPPVEKKKDGQVREICGLRKLMHPDIDYSSETGLKLYGSGTAIL